MTVPLNKEHFYGKGMQKMCTETFPDPFSNNSRQLMHARNSFENKIFWKTIIKNPLKVNSIFSFASTPFLWTKSWTTKGAWNYLPLSLWVAKHDKKILCIVIYHLGSFDDLIKSSFWVIQKITFANLCKPIHDVIYVLKISSKFTDEHPCTSHFGMGVLL